MHASNSINVESTSVIVYVQSAFLSSGIKKDCTNFVLNTVNIVSNLQG